LSWTELCKDVPLYGNEFIELYRLKLRDNPHIYQMGDVAVGAREKDGVNQLLYKQGG